MSDQDVRDAQGGEDRDDWRRRRRGGPAVDTGALVWGLILIAVGAWFFLDQTLGLEMPDVDWGDVWPIVLVVIGVVVIIQGLGRRRT